MSSVNKAILVGRLGGPPELRYTGGGKPVANFSMATEENFTVDGEKKQKTEWHKIVAWDKRAELVQKLLQKGSLVYVEGQIQSREYEDRGGQKKKVYEIRMDNFQVLGGRKEDTQPQPVAAGSGEYAPGVDDDSIPF